MGTQVVSMSFPAGTDPHIVQTQFAQAVYRSIFQQHGIDTSKQVFNAPPEVFTAANAAVPASTAISQAAVTAAGGGPITISAVVDGGTGKIAPSAALSKAHVSVGPEVLDPSYVMPTTPPAQKNPPGAPPMKIDPLTGRAHDPVATYGNAAASVIYSGSVLDKIKALGGTAAGAAVGALAGGPVGLAVGLAAGAGLDYLRAKSKKPIIGHTG